MSDIPFQTLDLSNEPVQPATKRSFQPFGGIRRQERRQSSGNDGGFGQALERSQFLQPAGMIRFDEEGKIVDFEVMVRPFNGLQALGEEMGARLAAYLPAYKAQHQS